MNTAIRTWWWPSDNLDTNDPLYPFIYHTRYEGSMGVIQLWHISNNAVTGTKPDSAIGCCDYRGHPGICISIFIKI